LKLLQEKLGEIFIQDERFKKLLETRKIEISLNPQTKNGIEIVSADLNKK